MICLTFDTDHMSETSMHAWLEACRFPGRGTFFCTGPYHFLNEAGHEVAPHPILSDQSNWKTELETWRATFPQATCWRAHSLVFSQFVGVQLSRLGYKIVSVTDAFARPDQTPTLSPWGVWQMPIFYMDNGDFNRPDFGTLGEYSVFDHRLIELAIASDNICVFDFHPAHYLMNTPNYAWYQKNFAAFQAGASPEELRFEGYGTASFFDDLVAAMQARKQVSLTLPEALEAWRARSGHTLYPLIL
jgi:hypothetical protein